MEVTPNSTEGQKTRRIRISGRHVLGWGLVLFALAGGLWVRAKDYPAWRADSQRTHYQGRPILTSYDGYYYLRYARDILESAYTPHDALRLAPSGIGRPFPPPLLSSLVATASRLTSQHWEWTAFVLPPLLAMALIIPLAGMARAFGGIHMALLSALAGLLAPGFVSRSGMGYLDTDGLVVVFTLLAALLPYWIIRTVGLRRWICSCGLLTNGVLFFLWWDMVPHVVATICLASVVPALVWAWFRRRDAVLFLLGPVLAGLLSLLAMKGLDEVRNYPLAILGMLGYVLKAPAPGFPAIGPTVMEQAPLSLADLATAVSGHPIVFAVSLIGLGFAVKRRPLESALLFPVALAIGCMAFKAARFSIFLSPVLAIGLGMAVETMIRMKSRSVLGKITPVAGGLVAIAAVAAMIWSNLDFSAKPAVPGYWIAGVSRLQAQTPANAVVWTWWDEGHAIAYWSRRATLCDGAHVRDEIGAIAAFPLTTEDPRQATNWIHFYLARGLAGLHRVYEVAGGVRNGFALLQEIMAGGPEKLPGILASRDIPDDQEWTRFFFPGREERRPVYLLLDQQLLMTSGWWFRFGAWTNPDLAAREAEVSIFEQIVQRDGQLFCPPHYSLDLQSGRFQGSFGSGQLSKLYILEQEQLQETTYSPKGPVFFFAQRHNQGIMCSEIFAHSVFVHIYMLGLEPGRYFKPIMKHGLLFQLWEVLVPNLAPLI